MADTQRWYARRYPKFERSAARVVAYIMAVVSFVGVLSSAIALNLNGVVTSLFGLFLMVWCIRRLRRPPHDKSPLPRSASSWPQRETRALTATRYACVAVVSHMSAATQSFLLRLSPPSRMAKQADGIVVLTATLIDLW